MSSSDWWIPLDSSLKTWAVFRCKWHYQMIWTKKQPKWHLWSSLTFACFDGGFLRILPWDSSPFNHHHWEEYLLFCSKHRRVANLSWWPSPIAFCPSGCVGKIGTTSEFEVRRDVMRWFQVSHGTKWPWLFRVYRGFYYPVTILCDVFVGVIISHFKDPCWTTSVMESKAGFFAWLKLFHGFFDRGH